MKFFAVMTHLGIRGSILAASLASSVLITRLLGLESLAQYNLILITFNLITFSLISPIGSYIHRMFLDFIAAKTLLLVLILFAIYLASLSITIIACSSVFGVVLENYYKVEGVYVGLLIFSNVVFSGLFFTLLAGFNILDRLSAFGITSVSYAILSLLIPYLLLLYVSQTWVVWLIGVAISQLIMLSVVLMFLNRHGFFEKLSIDLVRKVVCKFDYKSALNFCVPLAAANMLGFLLYNGYRFFLIEDIGVLEYGRFVVGYTVVAGLFGIIEQVITAIYQPKIYSGLTSGSISFGLAPWNKSIENLVIYLVTMSGLLLLVGEELILVVYGNGLSDIRPYLKLALCLEWLRVISGAILFYFQISKTTSGLYYFYFISVPLAGIFLSFVPWDSSIDAWILSIVLGCCAGLGAIIFVIARRNGFINIDYLRIIKAILVCFLSVYLLNHLAKTILSSQSSEIFLLISTVSFLLVFLTFNFSIQKFVSLKKSNSKRK